MIQGLASLTIHESHHHLKANRASFFQLLIFTLEQPYICLQHVLRVEAFTRKIKCVQHSTPAPSQTLPSIPSACPLKGPNLCKDNRTAENEFQESKRSLYQINTSYILFRDENFLQCFCSVSIGFTQPRITEEM